MKLFRILTCISYMSAWLCLCVLVPVNLAVSFLSLESGGKGGGDGLYLFSFFLQTTQNAVVLTSGLSVLWQVMRSTVLIRCY